MPERYRFDLEDGLGAMRDRDGVEADSAEQAVLQARTVIDEMRESGEIRRWELVIRDARVGAIGRLPLRQDTARPAGCPAPPPSPFDPSDRRTANAAVRPLAA